MDLNTCRKNGFIRKVQVDNNLINSIIEMSKIDEETVQNAKQSERNISTYCVVAYSSLRQILEAITLKLGYKITNHICTGLFLKEKFDDFDFEFFERIRKVRNQISYYGEKLEFETGKDLINRIFHLNSKLRKIINEL